jgi:MerR family mercuric resistance operon transcriptional regulator
MPGVVFCLSIPHAQSAEGGAVTAPKVALVCEVALAWGDRGSAGKLMMVPGPPLGASTSEGRPLSSFGTLCRSHRSVSPLPPYAGDGQFVYPFSNNTCGGLGVPSVGSNCAGAAKKGLDPGIGSRPYTVPVNEKGTKKEFLLSGELAQQAGVSTDTLRYYERKGLFARPGRSPKGYRRYPPETLERVRLVRRALAVGFTVDELGRVLRERDKGKAPCREVRALAQAKLTDLEKRIAELETLRGDLQVMLQDWDVRLTRTEPGGQAKLLEALTTVRLETAGGAIAPSNVNGPRSRKGRVR